MPVLTRPSTSLATMLNPARPLGARSLVADRVDARQWWSFRGEAGEEGLNADRRTFDLNGYAVCIVADKACQILFARETVNERTKTHTLNDSAYPNTLPLDPGVRFRE